MEEAAAAWVFGELIEVVVIMFDDKLDDKEPDDETTLEDDRLCVLLGALDDTELVVSTICEMLLEDRELIVDEALACTERLDNVFSEELDRELADARIVLDNTLVDDGKLPDSVLDG
ncbi:hypothetical protein G7Y89_g5319 [Cudoniella acicularis]|uniref:Uncharacterized protein n=1 Tax=Cudoniella acicularis TaxID=354080 RepID=A0A8H4W5U2_9HELO|nr:hypothetical protein G7Y89_g5319 [Cudoniella acicularis]